jgi:hypothetical protein
MAAKSTSTKKKPTTAQEREKEALKPVRYSDQEQKDAEAYGFNLKYPMPTGKVKEKDLPLAKKKALIKSRNTWAKKLKEAAAKGKAERLAEAAANTQLSGAGKKRKKASS